MEQTFRMISEDQLNKLLRMSDEIHDFLSQKRHTVPEIIGSKEIEEIYELTPYRIRQRIKAGTFPKPLLNYPPQYPRWNRAEVTSAMQLKRED